MKVLLLTLAIILIFGYSARADVDATIVKVDKDDNGNIRVWANYKVDGVDLESRYPKIDGKTVMCTRYTATSFAGMDKSKISARIVGDLQQHCESTTKRTYLKKANETLLSGDLKNITGSVNVKSATIKVDTDGDGVNDTNWTVFTNGTRTESIISTP